MPTVAERLEQVELKVKRAKEHIADLRTEIARFLSTQPYAHSIERDPGAAYGYRSAPIQAANPDGRRHLVIEETEARVARRLAWYADGMSPRKIAARLNAEGVPSPGARWKRVSRGKDGKWLASAIHGDVTRGSGVLNNARYVGRIAYGLAVPNVRQHWLGMLGRLEGVLLRDPERGREELRGILGEKIKLHPDESGRFLWADYLSALQRCFQMRKLW